MNALVVALQLLQADREPRNRQHNIDANEQVNQGFHSSGLSGLVAAAVIPSTLRRNVALYPHQRSGPLRARRKFSRLGQGWVMS